MRAIMSDDKWVKCGKCGHKLFRVMDGEGSPLAPVVEVKCHSCKAINEWSLRFSQQEEQNDK